MRLALLAACLLLVTCGTFLLLTAHHTDARLTGAACVLLAAVVLGDFLNIR